MDFVSLSLDQFAIPAGSFAQLISASDLGYLFYIVACVAFLGPLLVTEKKEAWLAYCLPGFVISIAFYEVWSGYSNYKSTAEAALGSLAGNPFAQTFKAQIPSLGSLLKFRLGAYVMILSAGFLAYVGVTRFMKLRSASEI